MILVPVTEQDQIQRPVRVRTQKRHQRGRRLARATIDQHGLAGGRRDQRRVPLSDIDEVEPQRPSRPGRHW